MKFQAYSWHYYDEDGSCVVVIFGITQDNQPICVKVKDFKPWIYLELPDKIEWKKSGKITLLQSAMNRQFKYQMKTVHSMKYEEKRRLYYFQEKELYPYLKVSFNSVDARKKFCYRMGKSWYADGLGELNLKVHEIDASPVLQFAASNNLKMGGWNVMRQISLVDEDDKETRWEHEYVCRSANIKGYDWKGDIPIVEPTILSFDLECYSSVPGTMPKAVRPADVIFQCACIVTRGEWKKKICLCLKETKKIKGSELRIFNTEADLIMGFVDLLHEFDVQVITGWNIMGFDIPYMVDRANEICMLGDMFYKWGCFPDRNTEYKTVKWSSSAYKAQQFHFMDCFGRITIDLMNEVKRIYSTLETYTLNNVSKVILNDTKDDLDPEGIFDSWKIRTPESLQKCAMYCIQDGDLVSRLFYHVKTWPANCEMSNICFVPILNLAINGQQLKVFSQVYHECLHKNRVVEKDAYVPKETDGYSGALVIDPIPGFYKNVLQFDFASLYPTCMIAYNICYSTFVRDDTPGVTDEMCHVVEFEEHLGCEHTDKKREKGKPILCGHYRYRFLKSPCGVIPTKLKYLLQARKDVRATQKEYKAKAEEAGKDSPEGKRLMSIWDILETRQLAIKVSANSMYGAMGVKKGYLPFMPGAMSITAKGRESVRLAADILTNKFGAHLVYGDSVTGDTPILVRRSDGTIEYTKIEDIGSGPWERSEEKDHSEVGDTDVWTEKGWTKIHRNIRHKTDKQLYRILTNVGCVDVTEDHSLLTRDGVEVRPKDVKIGDELMLHDYPERTNVTNECATFLCEDKLTAAKVCMKKGVYSLDVTSDGLYIIMTGKSHDYPHAIKKIIPLPRTEDYVYDLTTDSHHFCAGVGRLVVHNTDSCMVQFEGFNTPKETVAHAFDIEKKLLQYFPAPMKLEFELPIYKYYLALSKKRYVVITQDEHGELSVKPKKKGVMSVRRGYAKYCKDLYDQVCYKILSEESEDKCMNAMVTGYLKLMQRQIGIEELIVTTSMNTIDSYKKKPVPQDPEAKALFLAKKGCTSEDQFHIQNLPAHVQLGLKIRSRGGIAEEGSRLPWVITYKPGARKAKKSTKIEDPMYFLKRRRFLRIDYIHYASQLVHSFDELCRTVWKRDDVFTKMYKQTLLKEKVCDIIKGRSHVRICDSIDEDEVMDIPEDDGKIRLITRGKKRLTGNSKK